MGETVPTNTPSTLAELEGISPLWHHVVTRNTCALSLIIIIVLIIEQLLPFLLRACSRLMSTLGTDGDLIQLPTSSGMAKGMLNLLSLHARGA